MLSLKWLSAGRTILLLLCFVPLAYIPAVIYPAVVSKGLFFQGMVAVATVVTLWLVGSRVVSLSDARDPLLWSLLSFVVLTAVSSFAGPSPQHSLFGNYERMWGGVQWLALALFYILLRTYFKEPQWRLFLRAALYVAVAVALYGVAEAVVEATVLGTQRIETSSTLGNAGYFGCYMVLGAGLSFLVSDQIETSWRWIVLGGLFALFAVAITLSGNRSSVLGLSIGIAVTVGVFAARRAKGVGVRSTWAYVVAGALLVTGGIGYLIAQELAQSQPNGVGSLIAQLAGDTLIQRLAAWEAALEGVRAKPLFGWGGENFSLVYDRFVDPVAYRFGPVRYDRVHNVLLGKLVQSGPGALLAYLALWSSAAALTVRGWWSGILRPMETAGLVLAFTGYFVYLQFWFEDHSSAALLIILAAYLRYRCTGRNLIRFERKKDWSGKHSLLWAAVCVALLSGVVWTGGRTALAARRMSQGEAAVRLEERVHRYEQARRLHVLQHRQIAARFAGAIGDLGLTLGRLIRTSDSLRADYRRGVEGAEAALNQATSRNPMSGRLDAVRGRLAGGAGVVYPSDEIRRTARESMEVAIVKSPPILAYRHFLARLNALYGDGSAARQSLRDALEVYDGYGRTYYLLAQAETRPTSATALRRLRQALWLGYRPADRSHFLRVVTALMNQGRPAQAQQLMSVYFASHYLPAYRFRTDRLNRERQRFFKSLDADIVRSETRYRFYRIALRDYPLLVLWPQAALQARDCSGAILAVQLLMNGVSPEEETAKLRPTFSNQLDTLSKKCRGSEVSVRGSPSASR